MKRISLILLLLALSTPILAQQMGLDYKLDLVYRTQSVNKVLSVVAYDDSSGLEITYKETKNYMEGDQSTVYKDVYKIVNGKLIKTRINGKYIPRQTTEEQIIFEE